MSFFQKMSAIILSVLSLTALSAWPQSQEIQIGSSGVISRIGNYPLKEYFPTGEVFELKNRQIENQQQSEECYLFAFTNYLQVGNRHVFGHPQSPNLSGPFLFSVKLLDYIDQSLRMENPRFFLEGGNVPDAIELILRWGLVPNSAWRPEVPFHTWPFEKIYRDIKEKTKIQKKKLKVIADTEGVNSQAYNVALEKARIEIRKIVFNLTGELPKEFFWGGAWWTPQSFAQVYGVEQARNFRLFHPKGVALYDEEKSLRYFMRCLIGSFGG